jgi:hypothetical protein
MNLQRNRPTRYGYVQEEGVTVEQEKASETSLPSAQYEMP